MASFLFPLFASYKALQTSDPAQLTPWLMYWSVMSCVYLVESWVGFILVWVPFYAYMRFFFLLWLVLPQTQGARQLYETYLHPYLQENEAAIEELIARTHDRAKAAGMAYLRQAIEYVRINILGLPPSEVEREDAAAAAAPPQGYTQALLARFSVPAARWAANNAGTAGQDFFNLLAGAVSAAASGAGPSGSGDGARTAGAAPGAGKNLIPDGIGGAQEKMTFIAAQRERLAFMMSALDREAQQLEKSPEGQDAAAAGAPAAQEGLGLSRPPSGHSVWSALSKSRSEVDFEKIDAESGAEEDDAGTIRRRVQGQQQQQQQQPQSQQQQHYQESSDSGSGGSAKAPWTFLGWGTTGGPGPGESGSASGSGKSSGVDT